MKLKIPSLHRSHWRKLPNPALRAELLSWLQGDEPTLPEHLRAWFAECSRTFGWAAFAAFDRTTINTELARDYLARIGTAASLAPLSGLFEDDREFQTQLTGYRFGAPRLVFERSGLDKPRARLQLPAVQGTRLHYRVQGSKPRLVSISHITPLDPDLLEAEVVLSTSTATAVGNQLLLNLGAAGGAILQTSGPLGARYAAGNWLAQRLSQLTALQREFCLLSVSSQASSPLRPLALEAITQPAPEGGGDGAITAFIGLEGQVSGRLPLAQDIADGTWRYPLGSTVEQGRVLEALNAGQVLGRAASQGLNEQLSGHYAQLSPQSEFFEQLHQRSDGTWVVRYPAGAAMEFTLSEQAVASPTGWTNLAVTAVLDYSRSRSGHLAGDLSLEYSAAEGAIIARWQHVAEGTWWVEASNGQRTREYTPNVTFDLSWSFALDAVDGYLEIAKPKISGDWQLPEQEREQPWLVAAIDNAINEIKTIYANRIAQSLIELPLLDIRYATMPLSQPADTQALADLITYGHADSAEGLALLPAEIVITPRGEVSFALTHGTADQWSLQALGGATGDLGEISSDGVYIAPSFIAGSSIQVRVTAGRDGQLAHALITVVARGIAISPVIQQVYAAATGRHFLRAGGLAGGRWDTVGLKGTLQKPAAEPGEHFLQNEMQYLPPAASSFDGKWLIDEVVMRSGDVIAKGYVLVLKGDELEVRVKSFDGGGGATLGAYAPNGNELDMIRWTKLAGDGHLEGSRVSGDADGEAPFIVVEAVELLSGLQLSGYILLPLPLSLHMGRTAGESGGETPPGLLPDMPSPAPGDPVAPNASVNLSVDSSYFAPDEPDAPFENDTLLIDAWSAAGLEVQIAWDVTGFGNTEIHLYGSLNGQDILWGHVGPVPIPSKRYTIRVPANLLRPDGTYNVWATVAVAGAGAVHSVPIILRLDTKAPGVGQQPDSPIPATYVVTEQYLGSNGGQLGLAINPYADFSPGDVCELYLEKSPLAETDEAAPRLPLDSFRTTDNGTSYALDGARLASYVDGHWNLSYRLFDKAGNPSAESKSARLTLLREPLPLGLKAPTVPAANPSVDPLVLRQGVVVTFEKYANWQAGDQAILSVGGRVLEPVTLSDGIGGYFASIGVPASLLVDIWAEGDTPLPLEIAYVVRRLGWDSAPSPSGSFILDLRTAGPENPNLPDPINPLYHLVDVRGQSGVDNVLQASDAGQDATVHFTLYDEPAVGDELVFYWGEREFKRVQLTAADIAAKKLSFALAWALISPFAGGSDVDLYYTALPSGLSEGNLQRSDNRKVDVSALPFVALALSFPDGVDEDYGTIYRRLYCMHRYQDPVTFKRYVRVRVPNLSQPPYSQVTGDVVSLHWQSVSGIPPYANELEIPEEENGVYEELYTLRPEDLEGFEWLVPYDPYCTVIYNYQADNPDGMIRVWYSVNSGGRELKSVSPDNVMASFWNAAGPCDAVIRNTSSQVLKRS